MGKNDVTHFVRNDVAPEGRNDVTHFVRNDVAPEGRNDVMFAHCAVGTTSLPKAASLGEADIICPQGQTSFGEPAFCRSPSPTVTYYFL